MSEHRYPLPPPERPKHIPFWPVAIGLVFMVAVVVAGIISSNQARSDRQDLVESVVTSTTQRPLATTSSTATATGAAACSETNLVAAAMASGKVNASDVGSYSAPTYKCVAGYAVATLDPSNRKQPTVTADFKLEGGSWVLINIGNVDLVSDGVPGDVANQLAAR